MSQTELRNRRYYERVAEGLETLLARITVGAAASTFAMYLFVKIAHEMIEDETRYFDFAVLHFFKIRQTPLIHFLMKEISWVAGGHVQPFIIGLSVLWFSIKKRFWPDGATMLLAGIGGMGLIVGLKHLFRRPRPDVIFTSLGYSFPSGHSFFALVNYGLLAYLLTRSSSRKIKILAWTVAISAVFLVGFSRVYLGEHFPSDVAAGYAVGIPWLWGCEALGQRLWPGQFQMKRKIKGTAVE